jgi:hypothetical protein
VIGDEWGPEIMTLVYWLSDISIKGNRPARRYLQHQKYKHAPLEALCVKVADVIDNLRTLENKQKKFYLNTRREEIWEFWAIVKYRLGHESRPLRDLWAALVHADVRFGVMSKEDRDVLTRTLAPADSFETIPDSVVHRDQGDRETEG